MDIAPACVHVELFGSLPGSRARTGGVCCRAQRRHGCCFSQVSSIPGSSALLDTVACGSCPGMLREQPLLWMHRWMGPSFGSAGAESCLLPPSC